MGILRSVSHTWDQVILRLPGDKKGQKRVGTIQKDRRTPVFIAALFIITNLWNNHLQKSWKGGSVGAGIKRTRRLLTENEGKNQIN